jgi:ATP phosphoribosyltransferase regulatory subunit
MVFQIETGAGARPSLIAGGGRYDRLIKALSAGERDVPAVGAAIDTGNLAILVR